jgi:NAD(P)-dependent dehydrogenase (short-subunit alcohol dehydrogenase family)
MKIKDTVVLITGAAVRVGRTAALTLAEKGAQVAFSYYLDGGRSLV